MTDPAPSPFLPGTKLQYAWDSTSLGYLKTCPRLYQYVMLEGRQSKDDSVSLRFGSEVHTALQDYDISRAAGIPHDDAVHDVLQELLLRVNDWWSDEALSTMRGSAKVKSRGALVRTILWYLDHYKDDSATTHLKADGTPAVELSFRFETNFPAAKDQPFLLCGHLDKVVDFNGEPYVMDHKTTTYDLSSWFFSKYEPDNQMSLYALAGQVVIGSPVRGVIIDGIRITDGGNEFGRGFTFRTPDQLQEWITDLGHWLAIAGYYASVDYWPQNDTACDKFGGCRFRGICSKSPGVRERFLDASFNKLSETERWNPLRSR